jgi:hypothetical protein
MDERAGWGMVIREIWKNLANGEGVPLVAPCVNQRCFSGGGLVRVCFKQIVEFASRSFPFRLRRSGTGWMRRLKNDREFRASLEA